MPNEPEDEDIADLPRREAMSLLTDPTSLLGSVGSTPTTDPTQAAPTSSGLTAPSMPTVSMPHLPASMPASNAGGTYSPDATSVNQT